MKLLSFAMGSALVSVLLSVGGCATQLTIASSPPGATLYEGSTKLGVTPLELSSDTLKTEVAGGFLLRAERDGFDKVWLWIPDGVRGLNVVVNLQPFAVSTTASTKGLSRVEVDSISARILELQRQLLLAGPVDDKVMKDLLGQYPEVAAAHYLAGLNALRRGDKAAAQVEVALALRYSPGEADYVVLYRELGGDPAKANNTESEVQEPASAAKEKS